MPSVRSSVVDEERMRPGHWLGLVLCVSFSALTLMIGSQEIHPVRENNWDHFSSCLNQVHVENAC